MNKDKKTILNKKDLIMTIIIGAVVIIVFYFVADTLENAISNHENELLPGEIVNGSYLTMKATTGLMMSEEFKLPGPGTYHIHVQTITRGDKYFAKYIYYIYENDRFGQRDKPLEYQQYIGMTDDYSVIDTNFTIPQGKFDPKVILIGETSSRVNITISKVN